MVVLYRLARSHSDSCSPLHRRTSDGAPVRSLGVSLLIFAVATQTRFFRDAASTRNSTGNRTSIPRSPRVPCGSSAQKARAQTRQSSGSSS